AKVAKVEGDLEEQDHRLPDGGALLEDARRRIQLSANHRRNGNMVEAYAEAQRAMRPLRILMRAQWDEATKELDTPVASPYAVSFYTLPRHWRSRDELMRSRASANVLPGGDFEQPEPPHEHPPTGSQVSHIVPSAAIEQPPDPGWRGWQVSDEPPLDDVILSARRRPGVEPRGTQRAGLRINTTQ